MKTQIALLVSASLIAVGCSKNNDVHEVSPLVLESLDGDLDAGPAQDAQASDGGLMVPDAGEVALPAPEDFEETAERDITSDTLEAALEALESELSDSVPAG
jgi:hypothetical protein